jgi:hypothetical protein
MADNTFFYPVDNCPPGFINSLSGPFKLLAPEPEYIVIQDIAAGLSKSPVLAGQTHWFFSHAQHSILVSLLAPPELKRAAFLKEAPVAYMGAMIGPAKAAIGAALDWMETELLRAVSFRYKIPLEDFEKILPFTLRAQQIEQDVLQKQNKELWKEVCKELRMPTIMLMPHEAEDHFMQYFWMYFTNTMGDTDK